MGLALGKGVTPARNRAEGSARVCAKIRSKTGACNGQRGQEGLRLSLTCSPWQNLRCSSVESRLLPIGRSNR